MTTPTTPFLSQWLEKRWSTIAPRSKFYSTPEAAISSSAPSSTKYIDNINYNKSIAAYQAIIWEKDEIFENGLYQFNITVDDGIRLYIDGELIFSSWKEQPPTSYTKTINTSQGTHRIKVEYYNKSSTGTAQLNYRFAGVPIPEPELPWSPYTSSFPTESSPTSISIGTLIKFSETGLHRTYMLGTLNHISSSVISATNISKEVDANINIVSNPGIIFTPNLFDLNRNSTKEIKVSFDSTIINSFAPGINTINCVIYITCTQSGSISVSNSTFKYL